MKKWNVRPNAPPAFLAELKTLPPLVAQLLYNREQKSQSQIDTFLRPEYGKAHDPFLFVDMKKAVERVWQAIELNEKILIHGDYDADGVTSAAVLFKTLKALGAQVDVFIPHREIDGYGINPANLNNFIIQGVKLFITVDCGISNAAEIDVLNAAGVDVIVTDHHEPPPGLPRAFAILDPKVVSSGYPFPFLSGAGVAFKLAQALLRPAYTNPRDSSGGGKTDDASPHDSSGGVEKTNDTSPHDSSGGGVIVDERLRKYGGAEGFEKWLLDIVAIGTVADVVPLVGENRILAKWGLVVLEKTRNIGLQKLLEIIGNKKLDAYTIGFQIAPRLNAAGRMKHADAAFNLLVEEEETRAAQLAADLQKNNSDRQRAIEIALTSAKSKITDRLQEKVFFLFEEGWPPGLIGLIAGKLCDELSRPVIAMTLCNGKVVGSGRSVDGFNITQGLQFVSAHLARFGGHAGACGFTLNSLEIKESFQIDLQSYAAGLLSQLDLTPSLVVDAELKLAEATFDLLKHLQGFEPHGEGNEKPLFLIKNLQIVSADAIGGELTHLRLRVKQDLPMVYKMLWFGHAKEWLPQIRVGDAVDAVCEVGVNEWNGNREVEFRIVDLRKAEA